VVLDQHDIIDSLSTNLAGNTEVNFRNLYASRIPFTNESPYIEILMPSKPSEVEWSVINMEGRVCPLHGPNPNFESIDVLGTQTLVFQ
jgi:hypothetical protein